MYERKQKIFDHNYEEDDDIQKEKFSFAEYLLMLGKRNKRSFLDDESHLMLPYGKKLGSLQFTNKKQKFIKSYYT